MVALDSIVDVSPRAGLVDAIEISLFVQQSSDRNDFSGWHWKTNSLGDLAVGRKGRARGERGECGVRAP